MGKRGGGGGRGGGGRERGGGGFSGREDQYGGFGSQDRDAHQASFSGSHRGGTGGGTAGSQTKHKGGDLSFQRHVPKFLQQYSHLLGSGKGRGGNNEDGADEDAPVVVGGKRGGFDGWSEDDDEGPDGAKKPRGLDDDVESHALRRAMEENPELAAEFEGKLTEKLNQSRAAEAKEEGNRAFAAKDYETAVKVFGDCIKLDPTGEVYWSNRSAAHAALEHWEAAAADARQAVKLKPKWAKAHHRLAVAFYGLRLFSDSVESYRRALALEPDNQTLIIGLQKAEVKEAEQVKDRKHVFFKKAKLTAPAARPGGEQHGERGERQGRDASTKRPGAVLSFAGEDEEGEEGAQ